MNIHVGKTQEKASRTLTKGLPQGQAASKSLFPFVDNRPETITQQNLQRTANMSPRMKQLKAFREMANEAPAIQRVVNSDCTSEGRSRAALRVMSNAGGQQLLNSLFGFSEGDTVVDLRLMGRRLVAQFLPHGGTVQITDNDGNVLDDGTPLQQDEQYTVTPIPVPTPIDAAKNESGSDGDIWTGPNTVIPSGGVFEMEI